MPIGPSNFTTVRHEIIERTVAAIDHALKTQTIGRNHLTGDSTDYFYRFVYPGHLLNPEKEELVRLYTGAGWGFVQIQNSGDHNQRSGLFTIRLFLKKDSAYL